ncbi:probably inactive leucine-rich repeat receptor-like protein kinase At5g48380 [Durio zibethinus]|uniref:Probably inactive leucine-rich repeat receptor-like protein kinase At5g48380 n=1 Tax=Durio zibethinus TaxID=66656 RepID=A0A6P6A7S6_DURZI|nr:probably inactive leucine-rich repeat receptor-like protein kinase At5g48380 [Durio zibethinus]
MTFDHNRGLCGWSLEPCKEQKLIFDNSFKLGFIIGYIVFTLSAMTVFISYCVPRTQVKEAKNVVLASSLLNRKNKKKKADQDNELPTLQLLQIPKLERMVPSMSFTQLSKATDDFRISNIIGVGKMGTMYKAILPNGRLIAVKRLNDSQLITEEFVFELKTLGSLRHVNCVPLLGFCIESTQRLLVYKYMSNGNLYNWLHPVQKEAKILEWPLRVKIAIGLARGLAWLHHICSFRVAHLKLSSKCILLDQNFEPKLSNFGKAMLMHPNDIGLNRPRGFSINREFWEWDFIKKDVFAFGIVLLELITGEDPSKETKWKERFSGNCQLSNHKSLTQQGPDNGEILHLLGVASNCVQPFPERRPTMLEVYKTLRVIGEKYGVVDDSEIDSR